MSDKRYDESRPPIEHEEPRVDKPLHGPRRSRTGPLLMLLAFLVVLALVYWFGVAVLVPAD